MPTTALLLALAAAFVHALWNILLARARDIESATAVALVTAEVVFAPVVVFTVIMYAVLGAVWSGAIALAGGIPLFSLLFWNLRRVWHQAQLRRPY